jgi:transcriptional regulator NrdR family protein
MICPYCGADKTHVERVRTYDNVIFRWRVCVGCGRPFTTEELRIDEKAPVMGAREVTLIGTLGSGAG